MQLSTTESEPTPKARDPAIQQLTILATVTSYVPFAPSPERNRVPAKQKKLLRTHYKLNSHESAVVVVS
ncbi:hypothetical protein ACV2BI_19450, partial [Salmonella enterica subsp. enterica serovar Typhimurium]